MCKVNFVNAVDGDEVFFIIRFDLYLQIICMVQFVVANRNGIKKYL